MTNPSPRPTKHGTEFDRYYSLYKWRRETKSKNKFGATGAVENAARANAAVKRHYPRHLKWLVSTGRVRIEGKPKRSRLKPVWLDPKYKVDRNGDDAFTMCLRDKNGDLFRMGHPSHPRDHPAFLLEHIYWRRIKTKLMTPAFMKYVLKEYGYDLKLTPR